MVWTGPNPLTALAAAWTGRMGAPPLPRRRAQPPPATPAPATSSSTPTAASAAAATPPPRRFVYAGAQIIDPAAVGRLPAAAFSLNPVWDALIAAGPPPRLVHPGGWVDVGRPEGIALAEAELAR